MKRNREDEDKGPPSPDRKRKKNDPPLPGKPSYVHVGTFKVGERSFAKRQHVLQTCLCGQFGLERRKADVPV